MTTYQLSSNKIHVLEEYIDIDISSNTNSPPYHNKDFEFQKCSIQHDKVSLTSPADELFYKGKLLPLHIPPRLEMVQEILQGSNGALDNHNSRAPFKESCAFSSFRSSESRAGNARMSAHSCKTSPSVSCRFASELKRHGPDEYLFEWSNENNTSIHEKSEKSWTRKFKQCSLGQKLKASKTYLKSLFTKTACNYDPENLHLRKFKKTEERASFSGKIDCGRIPNLASLMKNLEKESYEDSVSILNHRRSYSGIIPRRHSASKCSLSSSSGSSSSSSSVSINPHVSNDLQLLKRRSSEDSESEISIKEAITHCKQSQRLLSSRKIPSEFTHSSVSFKNC